MAPPEVGSSFVLCACGDVMPCFCETVTPLPAFRACISATRPAPSAPDPIRASAAARRPYSAGGAWAPALAGATPCRLHTRPAFAAANTEPDQMPRFLLWLSAAVALGLAHTAAAIEAHRLAPGEKIVLDGRLDEPAWQRAPLLDRFWDVSPQDKQPARVRTEARFAYDRLALYVAVWA